MERFGQLENRIGSRNRRMRTVLLVAVAFIVTASAAAGAQTFTVVHNFNLIDGAQPFAGLTRDAAGNLYGTTQYGGILNCDNGGVLGCGVAYKLRQFNSSWLFSILYQFQGNDGGFLPTNPGNITLAPNGAPYGTQLQGGEEFSGTVFNPPASCYGTRQREHLLGPTTWTTSSAWASMAAIPAKLPSIRKEKSLARRSTEVLAGGASCMS